MEARTMLAVLGGEATALADRFTVADSEISTWKWIGLIGAACAAVVANSCQIIAATSFYFCLKVNHISIYADTLHPLRWQVVALLPRFCVNVSTRFGRSVPGGSN